jgi:transposase
VAFRIRRRDRVKILVWERGGFWLLYKRLETGMFATVEAEELSGRELFLLLEGIEVVRERRRYAGPPHGPRGANMSRHTAVS